jgi:hypothetical protein
MNDMALAATLRNLYEDTNAAIKAVHRRRKKIAGAINWADLSCVEACLVRSFSGGKSLEARYQVSIEEVAPDQREFIEAIGSQLRKRGWPDVEVLTEW